MSYFEHAAAPYPLDDKYGDVPNNILLDMSLTVNPVYKDTAKITALRVTPSFAFLAIETADAPLAHVHVVDPTPGRIYLFDNDAPGWVVFGPGVGSEYTLPEDETLELDPNCLIIEEPDSSAFTLSVNGKTYEMPNVLNIVADGIARARITEREVYLDNTGPDESSSSSSVSASSSSVTNSQSSDGENSSSSTSSTSSNSSASSTSSASSSTSSTSSNSSNSSSSNSVSSSSSSSSTSSTSSTSRSSTSSGGSSASSSSSTSSASSSSSTSESSLSSEDPFPPIGPSEVVKVIEISRNDDAIDSSILNGGMTAIPFPPVKSLGGAVPDYLGNIDIIIELEAGLIGDGGVYIVLCDKEDVSGYVLWTVGVAGCDEQDLLGQLKYGDYGNGTPYELPFDQLLELLKCPQPPCGPKPPSC